MNIWKQICENKTSSQPFESNYPQSPRRMLRTCRIRRGPWLIFECSANVKTYILALACLFVAACALAEDDDISAPDPSAPQKFSQLVLASDHVEVVKNVPHVVVRGPDAGRRETCTRIAIRDPKWIQEFANIVAKAVYRPRLHLFAVSSPIIFYDNSGKCMLGIEALPGNILRLNGEDYEVAAATLAAIQVLLEKGPN